MVLYIWYGLYAKYVCVCVRACVRVCVPSASMRMEWSNGREREKTVSRAVFASMKRAPERTNLCAQKSHNSARAHIHTCSLRIKLNTLFILTQSQWRTYCILISFCAANLMNAIFQMVLFHSVVVFVCYSKSTSPSSPSPSLVSFVVAFFLPRFQT